MKVVNKAKINTMIDQAEKNLNKVKAEIAATNDKLSALLSSIPGNSPANSSEVSLVNEITLKLKELRKQSSDARSEYYKLLYVIQPN